MSRLVFLLLFPLAAQAALPRFADGQVNRFVAEADAAARATAPLTPEFWAWVDRHPDIRVGLLFARHPMPAVHASNLDTLRRALKPDQADRYAHLLLAVAVNGDQPLRTEPERATESWPEPVARVAAWMRASGTTYLQAMADTAAALRAAGVAPADAKDRAFWTNVAHASGTYPPRLAASVPAHIRWLADRLDAPAPEGARHPWPIFPMARAPWPLLTWFRHVPPEREREWTWSYYWGRLPGQAKSGIIGYGRYSWDYERKPEVKHKPSAWHPSSLPRIWEDGGVCGRLSTMGDTFRRTLGVPARGAGQPGHRAFVSYGWDAKKGLWTFGVGQSIAGIEVTSASTELVQPVDFLRGSAVSCQALVGGVNLGLDRWHRARILGWYAQARPTDAAKARALREVLALNPYDLSAWRQLAGMASSPVEVGRLMAEMDAALVNPNVRLDEAERLSASTDFATLGGGDPRARAEVGNSVAKVAGAALLRETVNRMLAGGASKVELRDLVRAEIRRRAEAGLPHASAVSRSLMTRLEILADGTGPALDSIRAEVLAADAAKGRGRDQAVADVALRLRELGAADAALVAPWAGELAARLAAERPRWAPGKEGKAVAERLYNELHELRVRSLRRLGSPARVSLAAVQAEFAKAQQDAAAGSPAAPAR